jgi:uncharacterized protein (TIGR00645 family)
MTLRLALPGTAALDHCYNYMEIILNTSPRDKIERRLETVIFASRWLLAPFYLGLAFSISLLLWRFVVETVHVAMLAFKGTDADVILGILSLVDLALIASLLIIVIFSGYENFVSKIDHASHRDWPEWMGTIDFTALKLKLLSSIVAISAIQLLKQFMALNKTSDRDLWWSVVIHVVFVTSSVLLALSDRIASGAHPHAAPADPKTLNPASSNPASPNPGHTS